MPLLEFSKAPRLKSGNDVFRFVVCKRLGSDEPGALQNENKISKATIARLPRGWEGTEIASCLGQSFSNLL